MVGAGPGRERGRPQQRPDPRGADRRPGGRRGADRDRRRRAVLPDQRGDLRGDDRRAAGMDPARSAARRGAPTATTRAAASARRCATCAASPGLLIPLAMMAVVGTLAFNFQVLLPLLGRFTFEGGAGRLHGARGRDGGRLGRRRARDRRPRARSASGCWSARRPPSGSSRCSRPPRPTLPLALAALVPLGAASVTFAAGVNSTLQLGASPDDARPGDGALLGRLPRLDADRRADRRLALRGSPGPRAGLVLGGVAALAAAAGGWYAFSRRRGEARRPWPVRRTGARVRPPRRALRRRAAAVAAASPTGRGRGRGRACGSAAPARAPTRARRRSAPRRAPRSRRPPPRGRARRARSRSRSRRRSPPPAARPSRQPPTTSAKAPIGHSRRNAIRPGLSGGRLVAVRAPASTLADRLGGALRATEVEPAIAAATHQPAATASASASASRLATTTLTAPSAVATPATSRTVIRSRSPNSIRGGAAGREAVGARRRRGRPRAESRAGPPRRRSPTQTACSRRPSSASCAQGRERVEVGLVVAAEERRLDARRLDQPPRRDPLVDLGERPQLEHHAAEVRNQPPSLGELGDLGAHAARRSLASSRPAPVDRLDRALVLEPQADAAEPVASRGGDEARRRRAATAEAGSRRGAPRPGRAARARGCRRR